MTKTKMMTRKMIVRTVITMYDDANDNNCDHDNHKINHDDNINVDGYFKLGYYL